MPTVTTRVAQTFKKPNIAESYGTFATLQAAVTYVENADIKCAGLTVGIDQPDGSVKEYWLQPVEGQLQFVEKGGGGSDIDDSTVAANKTWSSQKIDGIKENVEDLNKILTGSSFEYADDMATLQEMKYFNTNGLGVGGTMPVSAGSSTSASSYSCLLLPCHAGEKFKIYGKGGNDYGHLWTFTDSDRVILSLQNTQYYISDGDVIEAPADSKYLYINFYHYNSANDKVQRGVSSSGLVSDVENLKDTLDEYIDVNNTVRYPLGQIVGVGTMGASLMFNGNNWVEDGCRLCGVLSYNKARSGIGAPTYYADLLWRGTYCTDEEFENMDILAIQFASSGDVHSGTFFTTYEEYTQSFDLSDPSNQFDGNYSAAQCIDYILKYWQAKCYEQRNNISSKWYGTTYGKPCRLLFVTNWHDARVTYDESVRLLAAKWGGGVCEFDKKIGFSKNQPIGTLQPSIIFAQDTKAVEVGDDTIYGWHPLRGNNGKYIQAKMANIFALSLVEYFSMN